MATTAPVKAAHRQAPVKAGAAPSRAPGHAALRALALAHPFGPVQTKLTVGPAHDRFEVEADRVADRVVRMSDSDVARGTPMRPSFAALPATALSGAGAVGQVQAFAAEPASDPLQAAWLCSGCAKSTPGGRTTRSDSDDDIQRSTRGTAGAAAADLRGPLEGDARALTSGGQPLPASERRYFEPRFGADLGRVRVHADAGADRLARAISAEAFTIGTHVAFRDDRYAPGTTAGRRLLAHELTHVQQQTGSQPAGDGAIQRTIGDGHDLAAPRFSGNVILEAAFDDETLIRRGATGTHVRLIQESLVAMGYALPNSVPSANPTQLDGIFGPETEAAIRRFQTDAGAVLIDGIVGPETMGLLDDNDVSRPGTRPPAITGPVAAPLSPTGCDRHFAGVTFTLANQTASGTANAAAIGIARSAGRDLLLMRGQTPINYDPEVTIAAPSNPVAANFRVGFVQNLLTSTRFARYGAGGRASTVVPTPIKDGAPTDYHPIFVTNPHAAVVEDFAAAGQTIVLNWPDVPSDAFFINLLDTPSCAGSGATAQTMTSMTMFDTFRTWVVVQHRPSGCVRSLHHIDWHLDWRATVTITAGAPTVTIVSNVNVVTQANGNGSPGFIQGGPVPGQVFVKPCS
jgi:peptidoglycan hydrolase-like protein with peptidoglycan-binding domain